MKFSDLVVLGSTMVEFDPTVFLKDGCGCLIGMAGAAKSGLSDLPDGETGRMFPWLKANIKTVCPVCGTKYWNYSASISCVAVHLHREEWTFEQALEYIRSIEPQEELCEDWLAVENAFS
jgi:hypothetical protein